MILYLKFQLITLINHKLKIFFKLYFYDLSFIFITKFLVYILLTIFYICPGSSIWKVPKEERS